MTNKKFKRYINDNPKIVRLMQLMGFKLGFGDMTMDEACTANGVSPELFATICDIYTQDNPQVDIDNLKISDIPILLSFLRTTHSDYMQNTFRTLHEGVHRMMDYCSKENSAIVNRFFDEFDNEMKRHISFEEDVVFRYVEDLLKGSSDSCLTVGMINEMHSNVEEKIDDFKNIVMNYLPPSSTSSDMYKVLMQILSIEDSLRCHTDVEEKVLLPLAEILEDDGMDDMDPTESDPLSQSSGEKSRNILSEREKEIITEVAKGLTNKEIADKLHISIFTVTTHRKNITQKLGIKTIAGLTVYALMNGFLKQEDIEL